MGTTLLSRVTLQLNFVKSEMCPNRTVSNCSYNLTTFLSLLCGNLTSLFMDLKMCLTFSRARNICFPQVAELPEISGWVTRSRLKVLSPTEPLENKLHRLRLCCDFMCVGGGEVASFLNGWFSIIYFIFVMRLGRFQKMWESESIGDLFRNSFLKKRIN